MARQFCKVCTSWPRSLAAHLETPGHIGTEAQKRMAERGWTRSGNWARTLRSLAPALVEYDFCRSKAALHKVPYSPRWATVLAWSCTRLDVRRMWLLFFLTNPDEAVVLSTLLALEEVSPWDEAAWLLSEWQSRWPHLPDPRTPKDEGLLEPDTIVR